MASHMLSLSVNSFSSLSSSPSSFCSRFLSSASSLCSFHSLCLLSCHFPYLLCFHMHSPPFTQIVRFPFFPGHLSSFGDARNCRCWSSEENTKRWRNSTVRQHVSDAGLTCSQVFGEQCSSFLPILKMLVNWPLSNCLWCRKWMQKWDKRELEWKLIDGQHGCSGICFQAASFKQFNLHALVNLYYY